MREQKWGVIEQFRVRARWRDRVATAHPDLLAKQMAQRARLVEGGAHAIGPFLAGDDESAGWLTIAWQFPSAERAEPLRALWQAADWRECIEMQVEEGPKWDPFDRLPGF
jgi:hypothetical protein